MNADLHLVGHEGQANWGSRRDGAEVGLVRECLPYAQVTESIAELGFEDGRELRNLQSYEMTRLDRFKHLFQDLRLNSVTVVLFQLLLRFLYIPPYATRAGAQARRYAFETTCHLSMVGTLTSALTSAGSLLFAMHAPP